VAFVVQFEVELRDAWVPVIRYDMAHGRAHIDLYETPSRKRKQFLNLSAADGLNLAEEDLKDNRERYRNEFLRRNAR